MSNPTADLSRRITFTAVTAADFEALVTFRMAAMRESLESVGRFDPARVRERLRNSFVPEHTWFIVLDGQRVGFHAFRPADDGLHLDHFYIDPACQSRGIGSHVLRTLLAQADEQKLPVLLGALRDSRANGFYQRHGFARTSADEWDVYYVRHPRPRDRD